MAIETIFWIVVIIFLGLLVFTLFKKMLKWFFLILLAVLVVSAFTGYSLVQDVKDFGEHFTDGQKTFLLVDESGIVSGFITGEEVDFLTTEELSAADIQYTQADYAALQGESYKLFIVSLEAFQEIPTTPFELNEKEVAKETVLAALVADDPAVVLAEANVFGADIKAKDKKIKRSVESADEVRAGLFVAAFAEGMQDNPLFLFEQFKKGNILIYEESILFKAIKLFPLGVFEPVAEKLRGA